LKRRGHFAGLLFSVQVRELRSVIVFAEHFLSIKPRHAIAPNKPSESDLQSLPVEKLTQLQR